MTKNKEAWAKRAKTKIVVSKVNVNAGGHPVVDDVLIGLG